MASAAPTRAEAQRWMADAITHAPEQRAAQILRKRRLNRRAGVIRQVLNARTREIAALERELAAVTQELDQL
jgi:hypothetical protein